MCLYGNNTQNGTTLPTGTAADGNRIHEINANKLTNKKAFAIRLFVTDVRFVRYNAYPWEHGYWIRDPSSRFIFILLAGCVCWVYSNVIECARQAEKIQSTKVIHIYLHRIAFGSMDSFVSFWPCEIDNNVINL